MTALSKPITNLPPEQEAIRAKCFHPTGTFVEFAKQEIEQSIPDRFERIVRKYPNRIAVKTQNNTLTYVELDRAANRVARTLIAERSEKKETIVALVDHDVDAIATILGVFKTSKTCVPLDPVYHQMRAAHIVDDSQAQVIITKSKNLSLAHELAQSTRQVINLDDIGATISVDSPGVSISPDTAAYILYTSGSTGEPKGVVQNHLNLLHDVMGFTNSFRICAHDRLTLFASPSGGQGLKTILNALLNGAAVYTWNAKEVGLVNLGRWIIGEEISIFNSGPTLLMSFMKTLGEKENFPDLRLIVLTGEPASRSCIELYKKHFSSKTLLVNMFGALEAGQIGLYAIDKEIKISGEAVPVGYATQDKEVLLLNNAGKKIDFNIIGEIAVRSRYLTPSYWRRPDLTETKLILDPDGGDKRVYLTGDLGLMLPDGCLVHKGRKDFRVKIRGYGVDITEVEGALREHAAIKDAVVVARETEAGEARLVAYFTCSGQSSPSVSELRNWLRTKLPDYTIPSAFARLDAITLTPNGKVDRNVLPDPGNSRPDLEAPYVAPTTPVEQELAEIWADTLGVDPVGIDDNFFDLGGHSLLAAKLFARLDRAFGRSLPLSILFAAPTVRALAERYRTSEGPEKSPVLVALWSSGRRPPVYAVPGVFGSVVGYADLSRELGPEQPFFGLDAVGLDGAEAPLESIEEIAKRNVSEVRSAQPHGPYALIGACFGATVAYEMARQLIEAHEEVAFLGLLDPVRREANRACQNPVSAPRASKRVRAVGSLLAERLRLYREEMRGLAASDRIKYIACKLRSLGGSIGNDNRFKGIARELHQIEVYQANALALHRYHFRPLNGGLRVLEIFESTHPRNASVSDGLDWGASWEVQTKRHSVPGKDSGDMVSGENARVLAALLTERLREVLRNPSGQETQRPLLETGETEHKRDMDE